MELKVCIEISFIWNKSHFFLFDVDNMYAGLMPLELGEKNSLGSFFFWLAKQRRRDPQSKPSSLIIWLNGGPGCSSMVGMMWENGPFTIEFGGNEDNHLPFLLPFRLTYPPLSIRSLLYDHSLRQ